MKSMDSELAAIMTNRRKQELDCDVEISPMKGGGRETFVAGLREQIIESAKSRRSSSWSEHPVFADSVEEKQVSRGGGLVKGKRISINWVLAHATHHLIRLPRGHLLRDCSCCRRRGKLA